MVKMILLTYILVLSCVFSAFSLDAWIRVNQLGYLPHGIKKVVLISESPIKINRFSLHDALTNERISDLKTFSNFGAYASYSNAYILDFSSFKMQGAFYIKVEDVFSPIIYIDNNIYARSADFALNYFRLQRCDSTLMLGGGFLPAFGVEVDGVLPKVLQLTEEKPVSQNTRKTSNKKAHTVSNDLFLPILPNKVDVSGGWLDASFSSKSASTSAVSVFQLLFAYRMNPDVFADLNGNTSLKMPNGIPDVLDEVKWGLDWMLKMNPAKELLYHQVGDDRQIKVNQKDDLPVYRAVGHPQGLFEYKNNSTGAASVAAKFSAAFALGASVFETYSTVYSDTLTKKAIELYEYGKKYPGVSQSVPALSANFKKEDNWYDDMELAATQLYYLTFDPNYLNDAVQYGRMEPVSPWVFADSCHYNQWYPFTNYGHFLLSNMERPAIKNEFLQNIKTTLQRADLKRKDNPYQVPVSMIQGSNNYIASLANQCNLYRRYNNDSSFLELETALVDWLFGCNPWGTSMVVGLPEVGVSPNNPHHSLWTGKSIKPLGGLVNGPVELSTHKKLMTATTLADVEANRFQSDKAVYYDNSSDFVSNEPTLDGSASLLYLLSSKQNELVGAVIDRNKYDNGAIVQTDTRKKQISLIFVGHQFVDGKRAIPKMLKKQNIHASFFFTGDFLRYRKFKKLIKGLQKDGHYIGPHSDKHLQYLSNNGRLLVSKQHFKDDLRANFEALSKFDIAKTDAPFFVAPQLLIHDSISQWTRESGLKLLNCSPGVFINADASIPEMRENYFSSLEIYNNIMKVEQEEGLNGQILVFNIGSDARRTDKFYTRLSSLLRELGAKGYTFTSIYESTTMPKDRELVNNKKRKN